MPPANLLRELKGKSYEIGLQPGSPPVSYDNTNLQDVRTLVARPIEEYSTGTVHVIFMPSIEKRLERGFAPENLVDDISSRFKIPKFFFDDMGWNANGFFRSSEFGNRNLNTEAYSYCTSSRYLTKSVGEKGQVVDQNTVQDRMRNPGRQTLSEFSDLEDEKWTWTSADVGPPQTSTPSSDPPSYRSSTRNQRENSPSYKYTWDFMGFCTYWRRTRPQGGEESTYLNIILCFDLSKELKKRIIMAISDSRSEIAQRLSDPFCLLNMANNVVVEHLHRTLWSFQQPIRNVEKTRLEGWTKTLQDENDDRSESTREREVVTLMGKYAAMHELNRHVHHIAEAMQVASNTLGNIVKAHDSLQSVGDQPQHRSDDIANNLRFQTLYTDNLRCRADAFVDRMKNETRFGFFGMNFFSVGDGAKWTWVPKFWMFFVITAPITFAGLVLFMFEVNVVGWIRRKFSQPVKVWYRTQRTTRVNRNRNRNGNRNANTITITNATGQPQPQPQGGGIVAV
ncbi:hypothetical protein PV08_03555 [Exophiala spinifera]|uniref:Uncharacterized protein n=1 Tax=Exophiala spinifera TaxID=91928 RepID=A0A0D1YVD9_9EURO|nr:uncharacterized protein PV08_03555 [Exophiala spinifera]KIW19261.1 hypothetical protein PV08_03555 [Exophiala spinifera]